MNAGGIVLCCGETEWSKVFAAQLRQFGNEDIKFSFSAIEKAFTAITSVKQSSY
jgi:hypothetical protein